MKGKQIFAFFDQLYLGNGLIISHNRLNILIWEESEDELLIFDAQKLGQLVFQVQGSLLLPSVKFEVYFVGLISVVIKEVVKG